ncbi:hypothetical protein DIPPA_23410 [Diplonema papillatum]|nr:hypothetical protein DIPPA_23410 [Diplonema papillatum]
MSRMIWGRVKHDGLVQQKLPFAQEAKETSKKKPEAPPGVFARGYVPVHTADPLLHGPSGGGERESKANKQPLVLRGDAGHQQKKRKRDSDNRHAEQREFHGQHLKATVNDMRERSKNVVSEQTTIDLDLLTEALMGKEGAAKADRTIFKGACLLLNTGILCEDFTSYHLEHLVRHFGGRVTYFPAKDVTHVVTCGLSHTKKERIKHQLGRAAGGAEVVTPEWVVNCLKANKRLSDTGYAGC